MKLTPARRALLQAVADGAVVHYRTWGREANYDEWDRGPGFDGRRRQKVTAQLYVLYLENLVRHGPASGSSYFAPSVWELTDLGRKTLEAAS